MTRFIGVCVTSAVAAVVLLISAQSAAAANPTPAPAEHKPHHWLTIDTQGNCLSGGVKVDRAACKGCPRPKSGRKPCSPPTPMTPVAPPAPR
jgi:hypothetical protein